MTLPFREQVLPLPKWMYRATASPLLMETTPHPQQMSANDLLTACASSSLTDLGRRRREYCSGFVSGVEEGVRILQAQKNIEASVCAPKDVSAQALADVYRRYAARHRQQLDRPAAAVVLEALSKAFPCDQ